MARGFTTSHPGSYSVTVDGALVGTFTGQAYYESVVRSDPRPGHVFMGLRYPTPYKVSKTVHLGPTGSWTRTQYGRLYHRTGDLYNLSSGSYVPIGWTAPARKRGLESEALIKVYERLKELSGSVNYAMNVIEGQQAIDLITSSFKTALRAYRYARKGFLKDVLNGVGRRGGHREWRKALRELGLHGEKPAKNLGGRVLQFNLGLAPIVSDIDGAIQDYMKSGPNNTAILRVNARAGTAELGPVRAVLDDQGFLPMTCLYQEALLVKVRLYVRIRHPGQAQLAAAGLMNPAALLWEGTPLSWIVDYAVNVSGWLNAIDAPIGWYFTTGYITMVEKCKTTYSSLSSPERGKSVVSGSRSCFNFERQVYDSFPVPPPPEFKNPVSLKHALNVVALFGTYT